MTRHSARKSRTCFLLRACTCLARRVRHTLTYLPRKHQRINASNFSKRCWTLLALVAQVNRVWLDCLSTALAAGVRIYLKPQSYLTSSGAAYTTSSHHTSFLNALRPVPPYAPSRSTLHSALRPVPPYALSHPRTKTHATLASRVSDALASVCCAEHTFPGEASLSGTMDVA